jgi:Cu-Zn family superoxide dismutase
VDETTPLAGRAVNVNRIVPALAVPALLSLALVACGDDDDDTTATTAAPLATAPGTGTSPPTSVPAPGSGTGNTAPVTGDEQSFAGTLAEASGGGDAVTYDPEAAPVGAEVGLVVEGGDTDTTFVLSVSGLQPDRGYAVHAHVNPCGPTGDVAGPHFQHEPDPAATPEAPSKDPAYANPENEVWLDLTTDADGAGEATATVPFTLADGAPQSIVIHAGEMTMTEPGEAGTAGDRIACLTTPLG